MTLSAVYSRIFKGSMPRLYENEEVEREQYYESYLETYISRDIKDLSQVADEMAFLNFMSVIAARTATNVNYDAIAGEVGVSAPTAMQWLSILVSSGLVALIQPYSNNALKRVIKAPRMQQAKVCPYLLRHAVIDAPNQAWSIDITYIPIRHLRYSLQFFLYLLFCIPYSATA